MYAVVSSGGKQYRVEAGSLLTLERLGGEPGAAITFDRVLLIADGDSVTVGTPTVAGASVSATVLGEALGPKLVIFKFKQKVKYRRRTGHRQHLTRVRIDTINPTGVAKAARATSQAGKAATPVPAPDAVPGAEAKRVRSRSTRTAAAAAPDAPAVKPRARRKAAAKAEE